MQHFIKNRSLNVITSQRLNSPRNSPILSQNRKEKNNNDKEE